MASFGTFVFVLHTHLPYCRNAGRWPHGEEWLYEAASETYIPLLEMLADLHQRCQFSVTMSFTPVLVEQLAASAVLDGIQTYIADRIERARADEKRFEQEGDSSLASLAHYFADWYSARLRGFEQQLNGGLINALRYLRDTGCLEVLTSAATHAYLPLLSRDSSIYAQIRTGVEAYQRTFGERPAGFWLPECAYRPAIRNSDGITRPGLEEFLTAQGVHFTFAESHAIEGGSPPTGTGHLAPWYGGTPWSGPRTVSRQEDGSGTTSLAYYVGSSPLAIIARNRRLSMQVWSADAGYPGDPNYREFHKRDAISGIRYWSVTGSGVDLGSKRLYDPRLARERAHLHAEHFAGLVVEELAQQAEQYGAGSIVAAVFDTELFGHWWHEGIAWLKHVIEVLAGDKRVTLAPVSQYLSAHPPTAAIDMPASSWGAAGDDRTWLNSLTHGMWESLHECEADLERRVASGRQDRKRFLTQACREQLLLQSSDWPFLVTTGQAREYAEQRFREHFERYHILSNLAQTGDVGDAERCYLDRIEQTDELFRFLQPEWFLSRQGKAS